MIDEVVFLDFDGVLHPKMTGNFELLPNFIKILNEFPKVLVVISSNWKDEINSGALISIFGSKYVDRVIGKTETLVYGNRQNEIYNFVSKHNIKNFIAIDDDCRGNLFDKNCEYLFKTDYFKGLTEDKLLELKEFMLNRGFYAA